MGVARLEDTLTRLRAEVRKRVKGYGCHAWDHVERVHDLCLRIGEREGADLQVLAAAALLHDIARSGIGDHARRSAEEARKVLRRLEMREDQMAEIVRAILSHSYSGGRVPSSLEGRVLSDADKLDAMGAVGVYRASAFAAERQVGLPEMLRHFDEKLLRLKGRMFTPTAVELAEKRHEFMMTFLAEIRKEIEMVS